LSASTIAFAWRRASSDGGAALGEHHARNERRNERTGLGRDGELEMIMREIESSAADRCVLSSEAFFVTDPRNIARVASAMKELDVRILAFVRRPDTMFMSIYTNRLKKMKNPQKQRNTDYRRYLEAPDQLSKDLAYEEQIDNWASVFGDQAVAARARSNFNLTCCRRSKS
jgi:hypothetical protein